jgi:hypothetical protein
MKRIARMTGLTLFMACAAALLIAAAAARGQMDPPSDGGSPPPAVPPAVQADPKAGEAAAKANEVLAGIRERGGSLDAREGRAVEEKLNEEKKIIDQEATANGDPGVASRLGEEFGISAEILLAEKAQYKSGWGDLTIAHLLIGERTDVTMDQLFELRQQGQGWGQIAHGMELDLGHLVTAMKSQGRVATGAEKADGKVPSLRGAEGQAKGAQAKEAAKAKAGAAKAETEAAKANQAAGKATMKQQTPAPRGNPPAGTTPPQSGDGRGRSGK